MRESATRTRDLRRARACVALMLLQAGIGIAVPAGLGWDFANFYDAGRRLAAGQVADLYDPEGPIAGRAPQGRLAFWSAPISAALYVPMARLAPETALVAFKLENTLALFAALAVLYAFERRFAGPPGSDARARFAALFAGACLVYQPLWSIYRVGGQTTPSVLLLLSLGLAWHVRGRLALSSLCLVVAVLVKPVLASALALLVLLAGPRFAAYAALELAALALVSLAALGWPIHAQFLAKLASGAGEIRPWTYNSSLFVSLGHLRAAAESAAMPLVPQALGAGAAALQLLVAGLVARLAWLARREAWSEPARRHFAFLLAILFCLSISRTVWEHYLALLLPMLAYGLAVHRLLSPAARRLLAAIFALSLGQNLVLLLFVRDQLAPGSAAAQAALGVLKSAPLALALWLWVRHRGEWFASHRGWPAPASRA
jgi:hypothetical protein